MKTVMGIDLGTQSIKVLIYNGIDKKIEHIAASPLDIITDNEGTREQKALWWIDGLKACLANTPKALRNSVCAVGISGQQHGLVAVDQAGEPVYNVKLWNDTVTAAECKEITSTFGGEERLLEEVGNLMLPGYTAPKILWLKKNHPDLYARISFILLPHDYLNYYLTGRAAMEYGDASGTGLLDIRQRKWSLPLINILGDEVLSFLPPLTDSLCEMGKVSKKAADELGIPAGITVSAGGGDNMMGAIGTGTTAKGILTLSLGTSGTLYGCWDKPVIDKKGRIAAFCSSTGDYLPLICTMNCTIASEIARKLFELETAELDSLTAASPEGAGGIITLPFYNGERTPDLPNGKGCILGMSAANASRENILRSAMESAIFGMKEGLGAFREHGFEPSEVRLIGGGSKSIQWRHIAANILNLPVAVPHIEEAAAFGAALQALWVSESNESENSLNYSSFNELVSAHLEGRKIERYTPDRKKTAVYEEVYKEYTAYLANLYTLFK